MCKPKERKRCGLGESFASAAGASTGHFIGRKKRRHVYCLFRISVTDCLCCDARFRPRPPEFDVSCNASMPPFPQENRKPAGFQQLSWSGVAFEKFNNSDVNLRSLVCESAVAQKQCQKHIELSASACMP